MVILLTRFIIHNFVVFVTKNFWVFISYTVHRNKLIDMFINNINGVINKNLSLFFFPSDIKLAWKAKQKQRELTKNQLFLFLCFFFLKIQDIRKPKTPIFERGEHKNSWVKCWPFFKQVQLHDITFCRGIKFSWETNEFNKCTISLMMQQLRIVDFNFYVISFVLANLIN